jgi:hypothetical protein
VLGRTFVPTLLSLDKVIFNIHLIMIRMAEYAEFDWGGARNLKAF